jgi:hypothetical protein
LAQLVETAFQEVRLNHRNSKGTREIWLDRTQDIREI